MASPKAKLGTMRRSYKFRIYPTAAQAEILHSIEESQIRLWNLLLEERKKAYEETGKSPSSNEQSAAFTKWRKDDPWFSRYNRQSQGAILKRLDLAYAAFFRRVKAGSEAPGFPARKTRSHFHAIVFPNHGNGAKFVDPKRGEMIADRHRAYNAKLSVSGVGMIRVRVHRQYQGEIKTVAIKRDVDRWFVVFSCDLGEFLPPVNRGKSIGIILGTDNLISTSDGFGWGNPAYLENSIELLRRRSRELSRKEKGSSGWRKAKHQLAKLHAKVADSRSNHHHTLARSLADNYGVICLERRNIPEIIEEGKANREQHDAAWGIFLGALEYKAKETGAVVIKVSLDAESCIPLNVHGAARLVLVRGMAARAELRG